MPSTERTDGTAQVPADGSRGNGEATAEFVGQWRNAAYNCYSSGYKFCREVCPVMQVTRNEVHTPTAFHANVVAMEKGLLSIEDVARDYVHCTQCGACGCAAPTRCSPGTSIGSARERFSLFGRCGPWRWTRYPSAELAALGRGDHRQKSEPVLGEVPVSQENVRNWADGLDIAVGGETILFCDCEGAFHRTSVPRAAARILQHAGVEFGLMREQWCCGGPAAEMGYVDRAREFAQHNVDDWRAVGAKRVIVFDPARPHLLHRGLPQPSSAAADVEIVLMVDLVAELITTGNSRSPSPSSGS